MTTTIEVSKKSIRELFASANKNHFLIPDYQRPYSWENEQVEKMFDDISNFYSNNKNKKDATYFLGSIVSFTNENGEQEIIDGQQRITTILLLLRAFYKDIEESSNNENLKDLGNDIKKMIWQNEFGKIKDKKQLLITSQVAGDESWNNLLDIMEKGDYHNNSTKDHYIVNYSLLLEKMKDWRDNNKFEPYENFINMILEQVVLLPISTSTQESAMEIFETLNDRGLKLSDADIFKAKMYRNIEDKDEKKNFIDKWKEMEKNAKSFTIQECFMYFMFYIRAIDNDKDTTTPGIRNFFLSKHSNKLQDYQNTMQSIKNIGFVLSMLKNPDFSFEDGEKKLEWTNNEDIKKLLQIVSCYPNDWIKYPVICYYLSHKENKNFEKDFIEFLQKLITNAISSYIYMPSVNNIKSDILQLNISCIIKGSQSRPEFKFEKAKAMLDDYDDFIVKFNDNSKKLTKMILFLLTYKNKKQDFLQGKIEIEHIYPKSWCENKEEQDKIEVIGNKMLFEKSLNIKAKDKRYIRKREEYKKSNVIMAKDFAKEFDKKDWTLEDIVERNDEMIKQIHTILKEGKFW